MKNPDRMPKSNKSYVLFRDPEYPTWWMKYMHPGFQHCACINVCTLGEQEYLIIFENLFNYISATAYFLTIADYLEEVSFTGLTVIEYEYEVDPLKRQPYYEPISCVTTVKRMLGIADWKVQTPYQLYKKLIHNGGKLCQAY